MIIRLTPPSRVEIPLASVLLVALVIGVSTISCDRVTLPDEEALSLIRESAGYPKLDWIDLDGATEASPLGREVARLVRDGFILDVGWSVLNPCTMSDKGKGLVRSCVFNRTFRTLEILELYTHSLDAVRVVDKRIDKQARTAAVIYEIGVTPTAYLTHLQTVDADRVNAAFAKKSQPHTGEAHFAQWEKAWRLERLSTQSQEGDQGMTASKGSSSGAADEPRSPPSAAADRRSLYARYPLIEAARMGDTALVQQLLSSGANVNEADDFLGNTAIMVAAEGGHADAVRILTEAGADLAHLGEAGSALRVAAEHGHLTVVRYLLAAGAPVTLGYPPLNAAAANGHLEVVRALLAAGASPCDRYGRSENALDAALVGRHGQVIAELKRAVASEPACK